MQPFRAKQCRRLRTYLHPRPNTGRVVSAAKYGWGGIDCHVLMTRSKRLNTGWVVSMAEYWGWGGVNGRILVVAKCTRPNTGGGVISTAKYWWRGIGCQVLVVWYRWSINWGRRCRPSNTSGVVSAAKYWWRGIDGQSVVYWTAKYW